MTFTSFQMNVLFWAFGVSWCNEIKNKMFRAIFWKLGQDIPFVDLDNRNVL